MDEMERLDVVNEYMNCCDGWDRQMKEWMGWLDDEWEVRDILQIGLHGWIEGCGWMNV